MKMFYHELLNELVYMCTEIIAEKLTGVYLHGSMAMGCFNVKKSDIDILVIINGNISDGQKLQFMEKLVALNEKGPEKGLEISIIKEEYCNPFVYPTPFELHFSPMHLPWFYNDPQGYVSNMKGTDNDLAAHVMITNKYGIVLSGKPVKMVFGEVSKQAYTDSIYRDIANAKKDIQEEPVYMILNLCRVLAFLRAGLYLSKEKGGKWGMKNLPPEYHFLIESALHSYQTGCEYHADDALLKVYAGYMLAQINILRG